MADQPEKNPRRSAADKERSRQQSRPVSGRDAKSGSNQSKSSTQSKGAGTRPGAKSGTGPGRAPQQGKGSGGRSGKPPTGKSGGSRSAPPAPKRSSAPFIWGAVALVLVFVVILVLVTVSGGGSSGSDSQGGNPVNPAPTSIVKAATTVPASAFDAVGVNAGGQQLAPPQAVKNKQSFTYDGKPGFFYFGAEFSPYCAAERWALVTSLARFGTFDHLDVTKSNSKDTDPNTATFSFRNTTYTSPYIGARLVENETGDHATLQLPTSQEEALIKAFNVSGYPFIDIGNKYEENSPEYDPAILQGLSWSDIASNLHDPTNPITQTILASSNYISAAICAANGGQPESVCKSKGVEAATRALAASG